MFNIQFIVYSFLCINIYNIYDVFKKIKVNAKTLYNSLLQLSIIFSFKAEHICTSYFQIKKELKTNTFKPIYYQYKNLHNCMKPKQLRNLKCLLLVRITILLYLLLLMCGLFLSDINTDSSSLGYICTKCLFTEQVQHCR